MTNRWGKMKTVADFIFLVSKITVDDDYSHEIKWLLILGRQVMTNISESRDITLPTKVCINQSYGFSNGHVQMWELDHKESWALRNWSFQIVVLEKTLESPLECKEIKPVSPQRNQPWILIERTDAEADAPILWPPDVKNWLIGKDPDAGKDWRWEEKEATEDDEPVGWHDWLNGYELQQTPGDSEGQGSLVSCSPWDPI